MITTSHEASLLAEGINPPPPLFRMDRGDTRYYAHVDPDGTVKWYPSVTSVIKETSPTPYGLVKWMIDKGPDATRLRDEAAEYGTNLHIAISEYFTGVSQRPEDERMLKDLLAWHAFVRERNVTCLASEVMLHSDRLGVAGTADLICELDWDKGRVLAMVDIKSGKNSYRDHAVQLAFYKHMWNECYPTHQITHLFNWHPKDWTKSKPTYALVNQTDEISDREPVLRSELWHAMYKAAPRATLNVTGVIQKDGPQPEIQYHDPDDYARIMWEHVTGNAIVTGADDTEVCGHV